MRRVVEGRTALDVPEASLTSSEPPKSPVFFNPAARVNRDISVAIAEAGTGKTFCDSLAGIGARGVRVANEVSRLAHVTMVDFNEKAMKIAEKNARTNSVASRCEFQRSEANTFLFSRFGRDSKFDFVDVDPFGTPVPYLQGAFSAVADGGVVSVTATDTAVLCGVYPEVARRRYLSTPLKNEFKHETAIRILMNTCRRIAGMNDVGVSPIAAHSTRHYLRVYVRARVGASSASFSAKFEGFVSACTNCGHRESAKEPLARCPACAGRTVSAGPMWIGPLTDQSILRAAASVCQRNGFEEGRRTLTAAVGIDALPPYGYSVAEVCSSLRMPGVSQVEVMRRLSSNGFKALKQPFEKDGLKTDANYAAVAEAVRGASAVRGAAPLSLHPRQT